MSSTHQVAKSMRSEVEVEASEMYPVIFRTAELTTFYVLSHWSTQPLPLLMRAVVVFVCFLLLSVMEGRGRRLTVIGHYPEYITVAKEHDAQYFDTNSSACTPASFDIHECWLENEMWLDERMLAEDTFLVATHPNRIRPNTFLSMELDAILAWNSAKNHAFKYALMLVPYREKAKALRRTGVLEVYDVDECVCNRRLEGGIVD
jgi:hypothetical protein